MKKYLLFLAGTLLLTGCYRSDDWQLNSHTAPYVVVSRSIVVDGTEVVIRSNENYYFVLHGPGFYTEYAIGDTLK